jgi:hypothetical protein
LIGKRQQLIHELRWSTDDKKFAFAYQTLRCCILDVTNLIYRKDNRLGLLPQILKEVKAAFLTYLICE